MNDENALIRQAQRGDHKAFLRLLERYDRQIMSVVYRFTTDQFDREDLYQEIFLQCFASIGKFRFKSAFVTWLYRIALNRSISYMKTRTPVAEFRETAAPAIDWEQRQKIQAVRSALNRLTGKQKIVFHLHYIEGFRVDEIAEILDCSPGTVKSHMNRARVKVREDQEVLAWQTT